MRKKDSPTGLTASFLMFLALILALSGLLVTAACGGSSTSLGSRGGGGGGGGGGTQDAPPCLFNPPASGGSTSAAGLNSQIDNKFFGMHINSPQAPWPSFPFGSQRLWASAVSWAQINTASGSYDWSLLDQWLSQAQSHGVDILYTLARTPTWASQFPTDTTCSTGPGQCDPPTEVDANGNGSDATWIAWVTAIAQHSAANKSAGLTGISFYEIWNEWNTQTYWNPKNATTAQLVRMEQDARCVVEGAPSGLSCSVNGSVFPSGTGLDPTAKIVTPSPVGAAANNMLGEVAASLTDYFSTSVGGYKGGQFAEVIGFHGYVGTGTTGTSNGTNALPCPAPENVNTVVADMNLTLNQFPVSSNASGNMKPLFNTEGGWSEAPVEGFTDPQRQAAFLPRYLMLQQSNNIGRVYWFAWDSKTDSSLYNDNTATATPASTAFLQVNAWTAGATVSKACSASGTVWTCGFTRPGYTATAVWDAGQDCTTSSCPKSTFNVPAGGYIEYRDIVGNVNQLNGAATVQIGAQPILLETAPLP